MHASQLHAATKGGSGYNNYYYTEDFIPQLIGLSYIDNPRDILKHTFTIQP